MSSISIDVPDLAGTESLGRRLGPLLFPGAVVALVGQLGAGKTHFTRAVAEGLSVRNPAVVTSPTFTLVHEYPARLPVYHFDAYRLKTTREFLDLGADEYFQGDGVCLVEWADRVPDALPAERLQVHIMVLDEHRRQFEIHSHGQRYDQIASQWLRPTPPSVRT